MTSPQAAVMGRLLDGLSALRAARPSFEERLIYIEDYPVKPVRRTRKRRPTLAGVARQAAKAGIEVAGYEVRPDGSIRVITGKAVEAIEADDATASTDPRWN